MNPYDRLDRDRRQMEELRKLEELVRPFRELEEARRTEEALRPILQADKLRSSEELMRPLRQAMEEHDRYSVLTPDIPDFSGGFRHIQAMMESQAEVAEAPTARRAVHRLQHEIQDFEANLDENSEVGIRLVAFGPATLVHVSDVRFHQPNLVILEGGLDDGSPVRLVQHLTQLNFLLVRAPRLDPDSPKRPIGFHYLDGDERGGG